MPVKPRLNDVLDTLNVAISEAVRVGIASAGITSSGQVVDGNAVATELGNIISKLQGNGLVALWPLNETDATRWSPEEGQQYAPPDPLLIRTIVANIITFAGVPPPAGSTYNVHTLVNGVDAYAQAVSTDTVDSIATKVATAVNALALPGVTASASAEAVTVAGAYKLSCNIGATGSLKRTVANIRHPILATVYAPDPKTRSVIGDAIRMAVGTSDTHWFTMSDGEQLYVEIGSASHLREKAQSSYSAFEYHLVFETEYAITPVIQVSQVGAFENALDVAQNTQAQTVWVG
jgi:hypothetical protein